MESDASIERIDLNKVDWRSSREFFESLGDELDKLDNKDEAYDFTWVGKRKSVIEAGKPINKTLRPDVEASKDWESTQNLFIEGDNLDALKLLQESYLGKVKMIYIDPPYNTGKDFVYKDNFKATVADNDDATDYRDEDGNINFQKNDKLKPHFHSDWLSMMYPRLKLARNLLSEDGVIFMSIDDNEVHNLRKMADEVFGEDNFVANFIWEKTQHFGRQKVNTYTNADYILCYARNLYTKDGTKKELLVEFCKNEFEDAPLYNASNPINELSFPAGSTKFNISDGVYEHSADDKYELLDVVEVKDGVNVNAFRLKFRSRWSPDTVVTEFNKGTRYWVKTQSFAVRAIYAEGKVSNESAKQILFTNSKNEFVAKSRFNVKVGTNEDGSAMIHSLFGEAVFSYPKPDSLIEYIASLVSGNDGIFIDFFSGSGTTAQAIMNLNSYDSGNRRYILVQLPEDLEDSLKNSKDKNERQVTENAIALCKQHNRPCLLTEVSKERIRRAGEKIQQDYAEQLAQRKTPLDVGFRALTIDDANHKDVSLPAADYQQSMLDSLVDNIKEDRSDLDLLYGVLVATAQELHKPLKTATIDGVTVHQYDYFGEVSGLVACFADQISEDTVKQIAQLKPLTAVFKESSFLDSQAKINLVEHFRVISPDTRVKVI